MTKKKVRVVFVLNDFLIGGVQRLYVELFRYLDASSYDMHLITLIDLPGKAHMYGAIPEHVSVHRISFSSLRDLKGWYRYRTVIRKLKPDLVFASLFFATTVTRIAGWFSRYPLITIEQNTNTWKTRSQILLDRFLARRSTHIIASSNTVREFAATQATIPLEKITVINNSIDIARIRDSVAKADQAALRDEFGFSSANKVVINVARLTKQKNHPGLIEAFSKFHKTHPDYRLLILGEGPDRQSLELLVHKLGMTGIVVLAGSRQDVFSYFSICEFSIASSFIEGFGIAHAEALAGGLPLVSTKTAGPDEMILEGQNGYFTGSSTQSICAGLEQMAEQGVTMGQEEISESVRRFDTPAIAKKYDSFIASILGIGTRIRVALMTYAIDNRPAKGTAIVARKCVEQLLRMQDRYELTFIHYEKCDDPIYTHGVREIVLPRLWGPFNRRSLRQILYILTTKDTFDIVQWFQPRLYPLFHHIPADHIVVEVHGTGDLSKAAPFNLSRILYNWIIQRNITSIDRAIISSEFARKDIIAQYGFAREQTVVIHNGVDPAFQPRSSEEISAVRQKYSLPESFFVNIARLNSNKNVLRTLQAYELYVQRTSDLAVAFVNVGSEGTEKKVIQDWLSTSSVRDRVTFLSYVDAEDLPALYSASYALVFPLLHEGFGLPAIEAMACGTPVVVSQTAHPEITSNEAILVDPYDIENIASGMARLLDATYRNALGEKGRERAKEYTWEEMGAGLSKLYLELATKP